MSWLLARRAVSAVMLALVATPALGPGASSPRHERAGPAPLPLAEPALPQTGTAVSLVEPWPGVRPWQPVLPLFEPALIQAVVEHGGPWGGAAMTLPETFAGGSDAATRGGSGGGPRPAGLMGALGGGPGGGFGGGSGGGFGGGSGGGAGGGGSGSGGGGGASGATGGSPPGEGAGGTEPGSGGAARGAGEPTGGEPGAIALAPGASEGPLDHTPSAPPPPFLLPTAGQDAQAVAVPEPGALALFCLALALVAAARLCPLPDRRRRR
jgi:hypothetical protein